MMKIHIMCIRKADSILSLNLKGVIASSFCCRKLIIAFFSPVHSACFLSYFYLRADEMKSKRENVVGKMSTLDQRLFANRFNRVTCAYSRTSFTLGNFASNSYAFCLR